MNAASNLNAAANHTTLPAIDDQITRQLARRCIRLSDVFHRQPYIVASPYSEIINECVVLLHKDHRGTHSAVAWIRS